MYKCLDKEIITNLKTEIYSQTLNSALIHLKNTKIC